MLRQEQLLQSTSFWIGRDAGRVTRVASANHHSSPLLCSALLFSLLNECKPVLPVSTIEIDATSANDIMKHKPHPSRSQGGPSEAGALEHVFQ